MFVSRCGCRISLQSDVSEGDWLPSVKWSCHSCFRVPEQDRERLGFVAGGFVTLWSCLISRAGVDTPVASHPARCRFGGLPSAWRPTDYARLFGVPLTPRRSSLKPWSECRVDGARAADSCFERLGADGGLVCEKLLSGIQKGKFLCIVFSWRKTGTSCRLMRVPRSSSHSGEGWDMATHRAHPHRTDHRQGEKHTTAEYDQPSDIGSTAWGWEHLREPEPSHNRF
jgi:hypothetical protein